MFEIGLNDWFYFCKIISCIEKQQLINDKFSKKGFMQKMNFYKTKLTNHFYKILLSVPKLNWQSLKE